MLKNYKELSGEIDMLQGNINRMCVTSDIEELQRMYKVAKKRIDEIYWYNEKRLIVSERK